MNLKTHWERYPALFVAISLACGIGFALHPHGAALLPFASLLALFASQKLWRPLAACLFALLLGCALTYIEVKLPPKEENLWRGKATFAPNALTKSASPFHESWRLTGTLVHFENTGRSFKSLPCTLFLPIKHPPPSPDATYEIEGRLKRTAPFAFSFKPDTPPPWPGKRGLLPLTSLRFAAKEKLSAHLQSRLPDAKSAELLTALATGVTSSRTLTQEFGKLGLQHLLAISGFHFGLIALILTFALRLFLSPRKAACALLPCLTAYSLFIGPAPSCLRAYITLTLFTLSLLFNIRLFSLNTIGLAATALLLIQPLNLVHVGFALSFLTTLGILLFFTPIEKGLQALFPKRSLKLTLKMPLLDQHAALVSALFRKTLALLFAVHLFAIPATLFFFGKFPVLSLFYNLFIPFWVGLALLFLCLSLFLTPLPWIGTLLHTINSAYTAFLLHVTSHPPLALHFILRTPAFPLALFLFLLTALFWMGLYLTEKSAQETLTEWPF